MMSNALRDEVQELLAAATAEQLAEVRELLRPDDDPFAGMGDHERQEFHAALARGRAQNEAGQGMSLEEALARLRAG